MANQIVVNNFFLQNRCLSAQTQLNAGSRLRLFKAAMTPDPGDALSAYIANECNFDTYSIKVLTGTWATPTQIQDGEYQTLSGSQSYASPATVPNTVYGLFVDDGSTNLLFSMLFDSPINYTVGAPGLSLQIGYQVWAKSIIP